MWPQTLSGGNSLLVSTISFLQSLNKFMAIDEGRNIDLPVNWKLFTRYPRYLNSFTWGNNSLSSRGRCWFYSWLLHIQLQTITLPAGGHWVSKPIEPHHVQKAEEKSWGLLLAVSWGAVHECQNLTSDKRQPRKSPTPTEDEYDCWECRHISYCSYIKTE